MKLTIERKKFEEHLNVIGKAVQGNSPLPALQGILITATESNTQLIASNGNLSIREIVESASCVKVTEPGKVLVPGNLFRNIIKKQGDVVEVSTTESTMTIESDGGKTSIQLLNATEYPTIAFESIGKELIIDGDAFNEQIKNVSFAAAENDKRIILNGVNLRSENGVLVATATNSFRLSQQATEIDSNSEFNVTILSKNLKDFTPKNIKGPLVVSVNDSKIITKHDNSTTVSKLIDGVYPNVAGLIPQAFKTTLTIDSKELSNLIEKVTVVAAEGNKVIKFSLSTEELTIESKRKEIGDAIVRKASPQFDGEGVVIALNSQFLKEAINRFDGNVKLSFNGPQDPIVIKGESNNSLTQLILPHRSY